MKFEQLQQFRNQFEQANEHPEYDQLLDDIVVAVEPFNLDALAFQNAGQLYVIEQLQQLVNQVEIKTEVTGIDTIQ